MTMDTAGLERAIVRHCSPTLAGMKPGCLFNVPGTFAPDPTASPLEQLEQCARAQQLGSCLDALVERSCRRLAGRGVVVRVVARRPCGALVYVYRPVQLALALKGERVAAKLRQWGYAMVGPGWLEASIERMGSRLERCHKHGAASFPHEVGFFLGYPYDDVMGFIEHEGRDYLCCGSWKVYSEREQAEACFARYKRCTHDFEELLEQGVGIAELASVGSAA